ncbi:3-oxoacyl-ACP reductase [Luteimonas aquatica]|uniref:3-oxoacyl-ACP reductase n=1 Tax=Luteimonas aquatica TaxID=450364 RepID=UPI001F5A7C4B|nr:3-oxoacyl-ACP reductase [Luteimonas aquatica]
MSDYLLTLANHPLAGKLVRALGLPAPVPLARALAAYAPQPLQGRTVLFGAAEGAQAEAALERALHRAGATPLREAPTADGGKLQAVVFDATGVRTPAALRALYEFFHPAVRKIARSGRVWILAPLPEQAADPVAAAAARGIEGFVRALAKEVGKRGATVNLAYVERGAEDRLEAPLRFFTGDHAAYVDGQALRITRAVAMSDAAPDTAVLAGKIALVTGSARGIGAATAARLAQEGAHVVCLDVPGDREALYDTAGRIGGSALPLDITAQDAPRQLADFFRDKFGGLDILVHNAGVTRDKTLANMSPQFWDLALAVNFAAVAAIDEALLGEGAPQNSVLREHGRIVCLSSLSGIAGNLGQTNYATAKAALIGYVAARAPALAARGICINAVAPAFIETRMTAAMPFFLREAGRRLNSLSQAGQPRDVAEAIALLSSRGAAGITGQTLRVCGQSLLGA